MYTHTCGERPTHTNTHIHWKKSAGGNIQLNTHVRARTHGRAHLENMPAMIVANACTHTHTLPRPAHRHTRCHVRHTHTHTARSGIHTHTLPRPAHTIEQAIRHAFHRPQGRPGHAAHSNTYTHTHTHLLVCARTKTPTDTHTYTILKRSCNYLLALNGR
eukprot:GDKI01005967.1.p1 GENE.GDKI01005967.1~~GDKI01005967.1.p1  ORF type:complete len:160 (+),score=48.03 GDKI01005967.1:136-615(+)